MEVVDIQKCYNQTFMVALLEQKQLKYFVVTPAENNKLFDKKTD